MSNFRTIDRETGFLLPFVSRLPHLLVAQRLHVHRMAMARYDLRGRQSGQPVDHVALERLRHHHGRAADTLMGPSGYPTSGHSVQGRFSRKHGLVLGAARTSISADAYRQGGPLVGPRPARLERVLTRSLGPSSIPSLGDGVMLGTAWIDRPVDTQGCAPCFHVLLSAAWKRGHAQANDRHSSRVFAMPSRGFARTTRNG